jgi:hypothetical protein
VDQSDHSTLIQWQYVKMHIQGTLEIGSLLVETDDMQPVAKIIFSYFTLDIKKVREGNFGS